MHKVSVVILSVAALVAAGLTAAAVAQTVRQKYFGVYRGAVVAISDPDGRHRVRVRTPDISGSSAKWAHVATSAPDSVNVVPEVGDEVVVAFEHGDPDRPIILGRIYNPD